MGGQAFRKGERQLVFFILKWFVRLFLKSYHRVEVEGAESFSHAGPLILVGNHVSYLDPFYLGAVLPKRVYFMAKKESFSTPFFQWILRSCGAFPVDREKTDMNAIKTAIQHLRHGRIVGLFPEGGRRTEAPMRGVKAGAAYLPSKLTRRSYLFILKEP
ncbi:hypothetical protein CEN49_22690 [Fischerella thermalis CCMEE 5273]|nr:hypothetical protein CEN49_22690 [Fischerella thermalis CCMEE 5273]